MDLFRRKNDTRLSVAGTLVAAGSLTISLPVRPDLSRNQLLSMNQVEEREQVDPDQVDQVPIQSHTVNGEIVLRLKCPFAARINSQVMAMMPQMTWIACRPVRQK